MAFGMAWREAEAISGGKAGRRPGPVPPNGVVHLRTGSAGTGAGPSARLFRQNGTSSCVPTGGLCHGPSSSAAAPPPRLTLLTLADA